MKQSSGTAAGDRPIVNDKWLIIYQRLEIRYQILRVKLNLELNHKSNGSIRMKQSNETVSGRRPILIYDFDGNMIILISYQIKV